MLHNCYCSQYYFKPNAHKISISSLIEVNVFPAEIISVPSASSSTDLLTEENLDKLIEKPIRNTLSLHFTLHLCTNLPT